MSESIGKTNLDTCGCCVPDSRQHPPHANRPGRNALEYRLATHAGFLRRMKAGLTRNQLPEEEGAADLRPLARLTTRSADDPAVALMDAWAMVADVLTFYQERIANEGFIRTATERRSVLELARSIGYELNSGVAAGTYLAFTADKAPGMAEETRVPKGNRVLSLPRQDKLPQTFETIEDITVRARWNKMSIHTPLVETSEQLTFGSTSLRLKGSSTGLRPGDAIVIVGKERRDSPGSERWDLRVLRGVSPRPDKGYTLVEWEEGLGHEFPPVAPAGTDVAVHVFRHRASVYGHNAPDWRSLDSEIKARYVPHGIGAVTSVAFSRDDKLALCTTVDGAVKVWNIRSAKVVKAFAGHAGTVNCAVFSPEEDYVISGGDDGTVRVWDAETGVPLKVFTGHAGPVTSVASTSYTYYDPKAKEEREKTVALSGGVDGAVILWDLTHWLELHRFSGHTGAVYGVALHTDDTEEGTKALSGGADGAARLWNVRTGESVISITGSECGVTSVAFSSDGALILSGGADGRLKVHTLNGQQKSSVMAHPGGAASVACGPDSMLVLSGGHDRSVKIWTLSNGSLLNPRPLSGHAGAVTGVAFSTVGTRILSGGLDKTIKYWEVNSGVLKKTLEGDAVDTIPQWPGFGIPQDPADPTLDLDNLYQTIVPGSWIALIKPGYAELYRVNQAGVNWRTDFGLSAKVTRLSLDTSEHLSWFDRRETIVLAQSEQLEPYTEIAPLKEPLQGKAIELSMLEPALEPGRAIVVSGRRMMARITAAAQEIARLEADPFSWRDVERGDVLTVMAPPQQQVSGKLKWRLQDRNGFIGYLAVDADAIVMEAPEQDAPVVSEIAFIDLTAESSDRKRTELLLSAALENVFDHDSVEINANVVRATHGETVAREVLGSGDGTSTNQWFKLKKMPLTYVSAPTPSGGETTLEVRVNDVLWKEKPSLYGLDGRSQSYIVRNDNDGNSFITFGDGVAGARLPTGQENVVARYRSGIGPDGEVDGLSLILLQDKPLGIRAVVNPLHATGAAGPETLHDARANAPLTVQTLERIVSIKDFQDFASSFAGVGKAQARALWNGEVSFVHITIATASGKPVESTSALYRNLMLAMDRVRDTAAQVRIDTYVPRHFNVRAEVLIDPRYIRAKVEAAITESLRSAFSFGMRSFGQQVTKAEVTTAIQKVEGVMAVNVKELHYSPPPAPVQVLTDPLPAQQARWEENEVKRAELLLINPGIGGALLEEMPS